MPNSEIIRAWDQVNPNPATRARILAGILDAAPQPVRPRQRTRRLNWRILAPVGAAVVVVLAMVAPMAIQVSELPLGASHGVSVGYATPPSWLDSPTAMMDLKALSEEELLTGVDVFSGTVTGIDTIKVTFGDRSDYWSLLTVRVGEVSRGDLADGGQATVLVHPHITVGNVACPFCQLSSLLTVGTTGVFLGTPATNRYAASLDGSDVFYYADVAQYSLDDPARYVFVQTDSGVAFDTWAWPTLAAQATPTEQHGISVVASMSEVDAFLRSMI